MILNRFFSFKSLRTRVAVVVIAVGVITTLAISLYQVDALIHSTVEAQEENSINLVNTVALFIDSHYHAINMLRHEELRKRKHMLHNMIDIAFEQVEIEYDKVKQGKLTEAEAKQEAIRVLKRIRYDNGVGYFWINDTRRPIPKMIMHATIPELDSKILDAPRFNCALGRSENLFKAMVDVCMENGSGYVDYLWPKPTEFGLSDRVPKLSYVKLFEPWGWIIGTGLYLDDIEEQARLQMENVVNELRRSLSRIKVAETGYMFLFTGDQEMLIHPSLTGKDMTKLLNPRTGNPILVDLMEAARTPSGKLDYVWDKPPEFEGKYKFNKVAFVKYFEQLDWYLASSVYFDEVQKTASAVRLRVFMMASFILLLGWILSFMLSKSITKPLLDLSSAAKDIHGKAGLNERVPVGGTIETKALGEILNNMLASLQDEISERMQAESVLKEALQEKEVLLREVHHRVKNNMAVVISMLSMQSKRVEDETVRTALDESCRRISAMSLIHETLYRSDNLAEIPLKNYISNINSALQQSMMQVKGGVTIEVGGDPVNLVMDQAVPCGLVLNELITNTLKYAFPNGGPGIIKIDMKVKEDNNWLELEYSDNGIGLPDGFDPDRKKTLGMRIVKLLVENQLMGKISWESSNGAKFFISWPLFPDDEEE